MKIKYIGSDDPEEHDVTEAFGQTFPKGKAVEVTGAAEKLANNPMFKVVSGKPEEDAGKDG